MKKLIFMMLAAFAVVTVACSKDDDNAKPAPGSIENIFYSDSHMGIAFTWDAFEGAWAYKVFVNGEPASEQPFAATAFIFDELEDGALIKIEAYSDLEMTTVSAIGEMQYVAPEAPAMGIVEDVEITEDENLGYFVRYKMFEGASFHRIYVNDKLSIDNVASDYMKLDNVVKFDTIRIDAYDNVAEAVIATGKAIIGEFDPDPVVGLSYEPRDKEVTLKWEAPRGGYTHIVIFDGNRKEGANKLAEVAKGTNEVVITGLENHTSQYLYVYGYNDISKKYNENIDWKSTIIVRARPEGQIDLYQTTWKLKDDANSLIEFWREDEVMVSDYSVHPPIQNGHSTYTFDYVNNTGEIIADGKVKGGSLSYNPDTKIITYKGKEYKQNWD